MDYALRDERYRYIAWRKMDALGSAPGETVAEELYDYLEDPGESVNLTDRPSYRSVTDRMRERSDWVSAGRTASRVEVTR